MGNKLQQVAQVSQIYLVEDDFSLRATMRDLFELNGWRVADFANGEDFLATEIGADPGCLVCDVQLGGGMTGVALLQKMRAEGSVLPAVMVTGLGTVAMAVQAMKAGAVDYIQKPFDADQLLSTVTRALQQSQLLCASLARHEEANDKLASLTRRQRQVMELVLAGHPSKNIAADLCISQRTVENHRASIMRKSGSKSLPALARLAQTAEAGATS